MVLELGLSNNFVIKPALVLPIMGLKISPFSSRYNLLNDSTKDHTKYDIVGHRPKKLRVR